MDSDVYGIQATIIDLGLSRMNSGAGSDDSVHWTPFDAETFEGEGNTPSPTHAAQLTYI